MAVQYSGNLFLSSRWSGKFPAEVREQKATAEVLLGAGVRPQTSPRRGRRGKAHLLGPAPLSPTQWPDCMLGPDAPLQTAAQKGFSAAFQWQIYAIPSGKVQLRRPSPRQIPGGREPAGCGAPGGEGSSVCRDTRSLSRLRWKCQNGVKMPSAQGLCVGRGGADRARMGGAESWKRLEITPRGETESLVGWWLGGGRRASAGQDIPSLS